MLSTSIFITRLACCGDRTTRERTLALGVPGITWMKSRMNSVWLWVTTARLEYTPGATSSGSSMLSLGFLPPLSWLMLAR